MLKFTANRGIFLTAVYCMVLLNQSFWKLLNEQHSWSLLAFGGAAYLCVMFIVLQIFMLPKLHRILMPAALLISAAVSYSVMVQGIYFNADQLRNVLQTDAAEASAYMSMKFIGWVLGAGVLPALFYIWWSRPSNRVPMVWMKRISWRLIGIAAAFAIAAAVYFGGGQKELSPFFRNHRGVPHQLVPLNFVSASIKVGYDAYDAHRPFVQIGLDAKREQAASPRKRVLILVVGETTRAANWGLNPGAPDTTPLLKQMPDVINFPHAASCGTMTAVSVPCLMSDMPRSHYSGTQAKHSEGLMDVLNRVGLYTFWRENDGGCKGACDRIKSIDIRDIAKPDQCTKEGCYDMTLLDGLQKEIADMPTDGVIVLHTMGSHGPAYYQRYPAEFKKFTPTCDTNQIQDCDHDKLVNTFNNSVVYVDYMLAQTIELLKKEDNIDAALWYFSDHGESLGEQGMYLHAAPYALAPEYQTHIPMIFWANASWYADNGIDENCLREEAQREDISHDFVFHSVLSMYGIKTSIYDPKLDMFAKCRKL